MESSKNLRYSKQCIDGPSLHWLGSRSTAEVEYRNVWNHNIKENYENTKKGLSEEVKLRMTDNTMKKDKRHAMVYKTPHRKTNNN